MSSNYIFTEPSPSTTTYFRSGRGGAGNTFRTSDLPSLTTITTSSSSTTTTTTTSSSSPSSSFTPRRFFSGIGGAGNAHEADQLRPALLRSLEDCPEQNPPVGYCGRGGAGNVYRRKTSDATSISSAGSDASSISAKAKLWAQRVSGSFGKQ